MPSLRHVLSLSLLLTLFSSCALAEAPGHPVEDKEQDAGGMEAFQKLLNGVDPPSLHAALHDMSPKKFEHGMFQDDATAVEVIHREVPSLATSIVNVAKRQDARNGTSSTTSTPAGNSPTTKVSSTTTSPGQSSTTSPGATPNSASTIISTSVSSSNGSPVSGLTTAASTSAGGSSTSNTNTAGASISLTAGQVVTTTNGVGLTVVSTVGGGATTLTPSSGATTSTNTNSASSQTSTVVQTSTLPNGSKSVVTAVTVVAAGQTAAETPTGSAGVSSSATSAGSPGLQTGEAVMSRSFGKEMVLVVGGAVVVAGFM